MKASVFYSFPFHHYLIWNPSLKQETSLMTLHPYLWNIPRPFNWSHDIFPLNPLLSIFIHPHGFTWCYTAKTFIHSLSLTSHSQLQDISLGISKSVNSKLNSLSFFHQSLLPKHKFCCISIVKLVAHHSHKSGIIPDALLCLDSHSY